MHIEKGEAVQLLFAAVQNGKVQAENGGMKRRIGKGREVVEFVFSFGESVLDKKGKKAMENCEKCVIIRVEKNFESKEV